MTKPYLVHCQNNAIVNLNNLQRLFDNSNITSPQEGSRLQSILGYSALILSGLKEITSKTIDDVYVTQLLGFLDTPILEKVLENPTGVTELDLNDLGSQLLYVAAAMGTLEDIKPYSPEELAALLDGEKVPFHESFIGITLGYVILNGEPAYAPLVMRMISQNYDPNLNSGYEWIDVFVQGLLMHAAWQYFPILGEKDRQYLLQHYFYRSIISNIPVKDWLAVSYGKTITSTQVNTIFQPLLASLEIVPGNVDLTSGRKFGEVMKEFITVVSREQISTLAQEQFLNKWYVNTPTGQLFRAWLRESLNIVYRIQTNTLQQ